MRGRVKEFLRKEIACEIEESIVLEIGRELETQCRFQPAPGHLSDVVRQQSDFYGKGVQTLGCFMTLLKTLVSPIAKTESKILRS